MISTNSLIFILLTVIWLVVVVSKKHKEEFTIDRYSNKILETSVKNNLEEPAYRTYLESPKNDDKTDCHRLAQETCQFTNPYMFMPSKIKRAGESCIVKTQEKIKHTYLPCYKYVLDCCRERNC